MKKCTQNLLPVFEQLTDGICLTNHGLIQHLNPAAERLLSVTLAQVQGNSLCKLLCERMAAPGCADCASNCILRNPAAGQKAITFDGHYSRRAFGWKEPAIARIENSRDLRVRCQRVAAGPDLKHSDMILTVIEDISAQKNLENEQEDWRNMIVHDLRTPLSNIYAALRLMNEAAGSGAPMDPPDAQLVEIGVSNCRHMITLLDLYLDVAKLTAGCMKTEIKELDFTGIARRCVEEQAPLARERRIVLTSSVPAGLKVMADEDLLPRVLQNLINNALKFTPEGGRVDLSSEVRDRNLVECAIADTGPGIAPDEIGHLFDRYHQSAARREGRIKGTGLGLAFCRQALATMNGDLRVESTLGEGSRFIFRLASPSPAKRGHALRRPHPASSRQLRKLLAKRTDFIEKIMPRRFSGAKIIGGTSKIG